VRRSQRAFETQTDQRHGRPVSARESRGRLGRSKVSPEIISKAEVRGGAFQPARAQDFGSRRDSRAGLGDVARPGGGQGHNRNQWRRRATRTRRLLGSSRPGAARGRSDGNSSFPAWIAGGGEPKKKTKSPAMGAPRPGETSSTASTVDPQPMALAHPGIARAGPRSRWGRQTIVGLGDVRRRPHGNGRRWRWKGSRQRSEHAGTPRGRAVPGPSVFRIAAGRIVESA